MKHFYKAEKEGTIRKVPTEPYEYTIEATGEIIELSHRWEFVDPALEMEEQVVEESLVIYTQGSHPFRKSLSLRW